MFLADHWKAELAVADDHRRAVAWRGRRYRRRVDVGPRRRPRADLIERIAQFERPRYLGRGIDAAAGTAGNYHAIA